MTPKVRADGLVDVFTLSPENVELIYRNVHYAMTSIIAGEIGRGRDTRLAITAMAQVLGEAIKQAYQPEYTGSAADKLCGIIRLHALPPPPPGELQ
jgi:hypothetical protein